MPPSRPQSPTAITNLGIGRCLPRAPQGLGHVPRHRARHQQAVGVPGRGDEVHAEALEVVVRSGEAGDLELAAVAGAGVDLTNGQRASEEPRDLRREALADPLDLAAGGRLGDDARAQRGPELAKHRSAPRRPARFPRGSSRSIVWVPVSWLLKMRRATSSRSADERIAHGVPDGRALLTGRHDVLGAQHRQLLRHGGLVEIEQRLELLDAPVAGAEDFEDPDPNRVRQGLEELGLEGLERRGGFHTPQNYYIKELQYIRNQFTRRLVTVRSTFWR